MPVTQNLIIKFLAYMMSHYGRYVCAQLDCIVCGLDVALCVYNDIHFVAEKVMPTIM